VKDELDKFIEQ